MKHKILLFLFFISFALSAFAAKKPHRKVTRNWNPACEGLLENSVSSTLKLEKTLNKKKKNLTQSKFNEKIQNELMVVQLNAWVCAVSSDHKIAAGVEQQFLQEYASRVQNKNL